MEEARAAPMVVVMDLVVEVVDMVAEGSKNSAEKGRYFLNFYHDDKAYVKLFTECNNFFILYYSTGYSS